MATTDRTSVSPSSAPVTTVHGTAALLRDLAVGLVVALGSVVGTWWLLGRTASYLTLGLALFGALVALILDGLPRDAARPGLGAANRVTLGRAALAVPVLALSLHPGAVGDGERWWVIVVATLVLVLDGVDGRIARRTGTETAFGARFDMEVDAALLMALALLVWRSEAVGAWVLLIGLMRYGFVAAGWVWPALTAELPPSRRRKVVCVAQGVVLLVALGPIIPPWLALVTTAGGLAALTYSFVVDVAWALRHGRPTLRDARRGGPV